MGVLSNMIDEKELKPGDHIYSWRTAYLYAHHGIPNPLSPFILFFFFSFPF